MGSEGRNKVMHGALLLTVAGLVSKVLSAGYRIPLQNLTGDIGFYIYQQIYPLLGIALVLSLYGFPSAISKLTADLKAKGFMPTWNSFYIPLFLIMFIINGLVFIVLYFNATSIAELIGDTRLKRAYQLTAVVFLLIPFIALLRGVFQGNYNMKPTAYSQVGEQIIRVSLIIFIAYLVAGQKIGLYKIGEGAAIASFLGMVGALIILSFLFIKEKPIGQKPFPIPWKKYIHTTLILGVTASLNHMVLLIIQFADVFTLVPQLVDYGLSPLKAMEAKGIFDRGQPLIQLGVVLGSSFALAFIPSISKQKLQAAPKQFYEYIRSALSFSMHLSIGATIGLIILFPQVNQLLFQDVKGTASLQVLVIAIFLSSLSITVCAILQGLGYMKRTATFILIACITKLTANLILVPIWGIMGGAIATVLSLFILSVIAVVELKRQLPKLVLFKNMKWWVLLKASLGMVLYLILLEYVTSNLLTMSRLSLLVYIVFVVITGAMIYITLLLRGKAFEKSQLQMLPFSSLFIRISKGGSS